MHIRAPLALAAALGLAVSAVQAQAAPCRDAKGHFTACPAPAPAKTAQRCRDAKGHFASCAAVGSAMNTATAAPAPAPSPMARQAAAPRTTMAPAPRASTGAAANTAAVAPGQATARCRDGTLSYSQHRSGSCSRHGGVAAWL